MQVTIAKKIQAKFGAKMYNIADSQAWTIASSLGAFKTLVRHVQAKPSHT